ncbi:MAG: choice-of-anchor D domain-containing protein, partial [Anaerolineae bacterium]|nr:choice-of-anchor D domain-containing protein [Anaerolineae bacterium]
VNSASGGGIWSAGALYLENVWLVNNTASGGFGKGGGLYVREGSATLSGTQVLDNEANYFGGGIFVETGHTTLNGSQVFNNVADLMGGGLYVVATATLNRTQVFSNVAGYGGGMCIEDSATLNETQVYHNEATSDGGGVYADYGTVTLDQTRIFSNTASQHGGGVYVSVDTAMLNMSGGEINDNVAGVHGGGMYILEGTAVLTGTQVFSNTALADNEGGGGGVYVDQPSATLSVVDGEINDNTALYGGGVYISQGSVTLRQTQVLRNTVPDFDGGGVYVEQTAATLDTSGGTIGFNSSGYEGGGVYINEGSATLSGTSVVSNLAFNGGGIDVRWGSATLNEGQVLSNTASSQGGGVYLANSTATLSVNGGEISDNKADYGGGGVWSIGSMTLNETLVLRNTTSNEGGGGVWSAGNLMLSKAYIAQNTASTGSAIYQHAGTITATTGLTVTGNIYQANGRFAASEHDLRIEGALTLAGGDFYAPYEPYEFVLTGGYTHSGGTYHQIKSVNGSSDVAFPKAGGLIINANGQDLGSTEVADTANGVCAGVTAGDAVRHCYLIAPAINTGRDATLTFYYRNGEIPSGQSCASMEAYRWTGAWDALLTRDLTYGTEGRMCGSDPYSIRVVDVDTFSPFAIHQPLPADISVEPSAIDFGERIVDAGPTASQTVTITNVGDFDLHVSSVSLAGDDASQFNLVADSGVITLTPGSMRTIKIAFDPTSLGAKVARLTITSDDSDEGTVEVGLSGRGISGYKIFLPLVLRGL